MTTPAEQIIANLSPEDLILNQLSFGPFIPRQMEMLNKGWPFVHYTTADTAMQIIRKGVFWLRNATCMNDYSEVQHGLDKVIGFFGQPESAKFWECLDGAHPGLSQSTKQNFDGWLTDLRTNTFLGCISEHDPRKEDNLGRLSMWRAYGSGTGVALVINPTPMLTASDALSTWTYPVLYPDDQELTAMFEGIVATYVQNAEFIKGQPREYLQTLVMDMLHTLSHCIKHPGFAEEREWRIVHRPRRHPTERVKLELETIRGIPQQVAKVKLEDIPEEGLVGITPAQLFRRLIIGPTEYGLPMADAFWNELSNLGVTDVYKKVVVSDIPLRG